MRVLIDEYLPRGLKRLLTRHECVTVQEMDWSGKKNGDLLSLADGNFDVLVTIDQKLEYQQNLRRWSIGILVLEAPSNQIEDLTPLVPGLLSALRSLRPGLIQRIQR